MTFPAPPAPLFSPGHAATTTSQLRYEDLTQDGRLTPIALPHSLDGLWRDALTAHPSARQTRALGIVPLLTRLTMAQTSAAIRVDAPVESRAGFQLARGASRVYLQCWADVHGRAGAVFPPGRPPGELVLAGRLFAEHVFTRPFAPPDQRRVTSLEGAGLPEIAAGYDAPAPATAGEPPEGARWRGEAVADPAEVCFGLDHTDSNQHVNSLVYFRVFLEAVQRTLAGAGVSWRVRSSAIDIAYRKPCFAGDRVRAHVRLYEEAGGALGAAGWIAADADDKPRCYVRVAIAA